MRRRDRKLVKLMPVKNPYARNDSQQSKLTLIAERIKKYEAEYEKTI